jgi:hypothetical protein
MPDLRAPAILRWTPLSRTVIFFLAAASIWCLLAEFYGLCSMRIFTIAVLIPSTVILALLAAADRIRGERQLWRGVMIGAVAGIVAACAYDIFRLPFVVAAIDGIGPDWLRLPLFKAFPRFGAMILGQPFDAAATDSQFSLGAHLVGWVYHFSNGLTFGIMYVALVGDPRRRSWWGVLFATGLELALLLTPYPSFFGINASMRFVIVTFAAHAIFGLVMGLLARQMARCWPAAIPT